MIPSFPRRRSSRLSHTTQTEDKKRNVSGDDTNRSCQSTLVTDKRHMSGSTNGSRPSTRSLAKKLSSSSLGASLIFRPIITGRAPSLIAETSIEPVNRRSGTQKRHPSIKTLWYLRGAYVTVRNEEAGWYLCRLQHSVYNTTKSVKIQWLSKKRRRKGSSPVKENEYEIDYQDEIDPACILFTVRVIRHRSTYTLYDEDRLETERLLSVAVDVEDGKLMSEDVDSDVEEVVQIEPPTKKKKPDGNKKSDKMKEFKGNSSKRNTNIEKKRKSQKKLVKGKMKERKMEERKRKVTKKKEQHLLLHPNPDVKVHKKDPFFETNQPVPFISKYAHSRLVYRAVHMKDYKLLKKLTKDTEKVRQLSHWQSIARNGTALYLAISQKDPEAIKLLYQDFYSISSDSNREKRMEKTVADKISISNLETGAYNFNSLGTDSIKQITASRGGREGSNALTKDLKDMRGEEKVKLTSYIRVMMASGLDFVTVKEILADDDMLMSDPEFLSEKQAKPSTNIGHRWSGFIDYIVLKKIHLALEYGHYQLAGNFLRSIKDNTRMIDRKQISNLHCNVLLSDKPLTDVTPSQVTCAIKIAHRLTPVHCAACNPDTKHLEKLLEVVPDVHVPDKLKRRPIHFAAACEGTGPLELLVKRAPNQGPYFRRYLSTKMAAKIRAQRFKFLVFLTNDVENFHDGARISESDGDGNVPLVYAVCANRVQNAQFLITMGSGLGTAGEDDPWIVRYGRAGINRPNKLLVTPIHVAAEEGYLDMLKLLVKNGANVNVTLNRAHAKLTPLMLAAETGRFDCAVCLVENGAVVQQTDQLGRTAVIHAAMNGNTNILSYLLNIGASPQLSDNSGNCPLHYAAAYGWYFCVRTLLEAGADVSVENDWKITPLAIAYMKGHTGIVTYLLEESNVDVNFRDDAGMILLSTATSSALCPDLYNQIHYLIKDKGAVCTFRDVEDATPLHHLARNDIMLEGSVKHPVPSEEAMSTSVKIAQLLIDHGCDVQAVDKEGMTAAMAAMRSGNLKLFKYLVEAWCPVFTDSDKIGNNILHLLCMDYLGTSKDYLGMLKVTAQMDGKSGKQDLKKDFCTMTQTYNQAGSTPLLLACQCYQTFSKSCNPGDSDEDKAHVRLFWERGREFIKFLINELGSDVNDIVQGSVCEKTADSQSCRQWSVAQILSEVEYCEYGGLREEDEPEYPALRMILKYKPNMNTRDSMGFVPLNRLVKYNMLTPATILVKESNAEVDSYQILEENGEKYKIWTIAAAMMVRSLPLVQMLLEAGANLEKGDERDGNLPIHTAAMLDSDKEDTLKMMQTLLDHGADVNSRNREQRTALHLAVNYNEGKMDANFDVILALIDKGADLTVKDKDGRTPLHYVFLGIGRHTSSEQHDPVELCRIIASRMKSADLNIQDKFGMTALHCAAYRGANICCMYLLERGADMNLKDSNGNTALTMSLKGFHDGWVSVNNSCATVLIQNGASVRDLVVLVNEDISTNGDEDADNGEEMKKSVWKLNSQQQNKQIKTTQEMRLYEFALQHEIQGVFYMVMDKPVSESGITFGDVVESCLKLQKYNIVLRLLTTTDDVSSLHKDWDHGRNLLHVLSLTAKKFDDSVKKVAEELIEKGVSPSKQDDYKCTPLLYASLNQNFELCRFYILLASTEMYNPTYKDIFHRSVLSAAFWKPLPLDLRDGIKKLLIREAFLNELIDRPLHEGQFGVLDTVSDHNYWRTYNCVKISPLIITIHHHYLDLTQWMLKDSGASVNLPDSEGRTPLMHAVLVNDLNIVKALLNFDFNPWAQDEDETTEQTQEAQKQSKRYKQTEHTFKLKRNSSRMSEDEEVETKEVEEDFSNNQGEKENQEKGFKPYKKVSNVNLNTKDKNGWTVIHHAVSPLSFGTFDNDEIVFILAKAGAKLNVKNKKGETPLDLAIKNRAVRVARMIQKLEGVSEENMLDTKYSTVTVSDNLKWADPKPSFYEDAEKLLEKLGKPIDVEEEYQGKIDSNCKVTNGILVKDEDQNLLYDVLLTKVDVNRLEWKLYNFYKIQLIHQAGKDLYILFTRWGRIGDDGQYQHTPYQQTEEAVREFCKVFRAKTGNKWTDIKSFEYKPNKYHLVENKVRCQIHSQKDISFVCKSSLESKLPFHLQYVMKQMFDLKSLKPAVSKEMDPDFAPVGQIQRERLLKARSLLQKISVFVDEVECYRKGVTGCRGVDSALKEKYLKNCQQIGELSNEYFQIIPQREFRFEKARPLDYLSNLTKHIQLVSYLLDFEVASCIVCGAKYREKEVNPLDYVYRSLGCQIQLMSEDDQESQYILKYILNSAPDTKVQAIYRLQVEGEETHLRKTGLGNRRLLWHSGVVSNFLSVLHRGLVIPPVDKAFMGHLFGQGLYFTDSFEKSASSNETSSDKTHFLFLCEVALGKSKQHLFPGAYMNKVEREYDSVTIVGRNQPVKRQDVCLPTGCVLPLGVVVKEDYFDGSSLSSDYSEYIVYSEDQVCLRYLVEYRKP